MNTKNHLSARTAYTLGLITFAELEAAYDLIDAGDVAGLSRLLLAAALRTSVLEG